MGRLRPGRFWRGGRPVAVGIPRPFLTSPCVAATQSIATRSRHNLAPFTHVLVSELRDDGATPRYPSSIDPKVERSMARIELPWLRLSHNAMSATTGSSSAGAGVGSTMPVAIASSACAVQPGAYRAAYTSPFVAQAGNRLSNRRKIGLYRGPCLDANRAGTIPDACHA